LTTHETIQTGWNGLDWNSIIHRGVEVQLDCTPDFETVKFSANTKAASQPWFTTVLAG
jgi:hypothetical protein